MALAADVHLGLSSQVDWTLFRALAREVLALAGMLGVEEG